jgi:hypothetical protein
MKQKYNFALLKLFICSSICFLGVLFWSPINFLNIFINFSATFSASYFFIKDFMIFKEAIKINQLNSTSLREIFQE